MADNRRTFLQKLGLIGTGSVVLSKFGLSQINTNIKPEDMVSNIQPLGFQWKTRDPFLFCVHHEDFYPRGNAQLGPDASLEGRHIGQDFIVKDGWRMYHGDKVPGFPGHPHRGFETITVVRKGMVDHSDSTGASGRYGDGDVQWMTAGKGVQHAEMFPLLRKDEDNPLELFQIWLNLPKSGKFVEPHFKMLWRDTIPKVNHKDENGKVTKIEVIAGKVNNSAAPAPPPDSWAAPSSNHVAVWNIEMEANAQFTLPATERGINRTVYFYKGDQLNINGVNVPHYHSAEIGETQNIVLTASSEGAKILILQGKPIAEPVVQHGPFVMNSREEIQQAFNDYQRTKFGGWPWDSYGQVHDRELGRFAKHSDGREEIPS